MNSKALCFITPSLMRTQNMARLHTEARARRAEWGGPTRSGARALCRHNSSSGEMAALWGPWSPSLLPAKPEAADTPGTPWGSLENCPAVSEDTSRERLGSASGEHYRGSCMLLFFRDDNGDFTAARGHRGSCSLADQLVAFKGPPTRTPASDGVKPSILLVPESRSQ